MTRLTSISLKKFAFFFFPLVIFPSCGSRNHLADESHETISDHQDEQPRELSEMEKLRAAEPERPYVEREVTAFKAKGRCSQGPFHVRVKALGAKFGERLIVEACTPREFKGVYRLKVGDRQHDPRAFGFAHLNDRCRATESELARLGSDRSSKQADGSSKTSNSGDSGSKNKNAEPIEHPLEEFQASDYQCEQIRVQIVHHGWETASGSVLDSGEELDLEFWSLDPVDLEGVVFLARQFGIDESMTTEAWVELSERWDRWHEQYMAQLDREVSAGRMEILDRTPDAEGQPPPPPQAETQPPRPSRNARWIPGYWHFESEWAWIPGLWRVPEQDIETGQTVSAPQAPPPLRVESRPNKPAEAAIWTPGYWSWNGRAYVWIDGAWRIPPRQGLIWRPHQWAPRQRGVIFQPGGWTIQILPR